MNKKEIRKRMNEGFSEIAPDICEDIWISALENQELFNKIPAEKEITFFNKIRNYLMGLTRKKAVWGSVGAVLVCVCFCLLIGLVQNEICIIMDVNPSIEILADKTYKVKQINALNEDARNVLEKLEWQKNDSLEVVMDELLEELVKQEYLREESGILLSVSKTQKEEYQFIQDTLGNCIYHKLETMELAGIKAAFRYTKKSVGRVGLEEEILKKSNLDKAIVKNMSVSELIEVCEEENALQIQIPQKYYEESSQEKTKESFSGENTTKNPVENVSNKVVNNPPDENQDMQKESANEKKNDGNIGNNTPENTDVKKQEAGLSGKEPNPNQSGGTASKLPQDSIEGNVNTNPPEKETNKVPQGSAGGNVNTNPPEKETNKVPQGSTEGNANTNPPEKEANKEPQGPTEGSVNTNPPGNVTNKEPQGPTEGSVNTNPPGKETNKVPQGPAEGNVNTNPPAKETNKAPQGPAEGSGNRNPAGNMGNQIYDGAKNTRPNDQRIR